MRSLFFLLLLSTNVIAERYSDKDAYSAVDPESNVLGEVAKAYNGIETVMSPSGSRIIGMANKTVNPYGSETAEIGNLNIIVAPNNPVGGRPMIIPPSIQNNNAPINSLLNNHLGNTGTRYDSQ